MHDNRKPNTLYKFRTWADKHHRTLLTESKLWVPVATDLNDPFDCCIPFRYDLMEYEDLLEWFVRCPPARYQDSPITVITEWAKARIEELGICDPDRKDEVLEGFALRYRANQGVLSFATIRDAPLLWSHYADCHRGFSVGLDYDKFRVAMARRILEIPAMSERWVRYVSEFPVVIPSNDNVAFRDAYIQFLVTKSEHWSYEMEYRYVFPMKFDFELILDTSCVSEVILGSEISVEDRTAIRIFAQKRFPLAKVLQARKRPFAFELEFIPLE